MSSPLHQVTDFTWRQPKNGAPRWAIVGGLHGDEPDGAALIESMSNPAHEIWRGGCPVDLTLIIGNPLALERNQRGSESGADLNRFFGKNPPKTPTYEFERAQQIREVLTPIDVLIDLHQTQRPIIPLAVVEDTPAHLALAARSGVGTAVIGAERIYGDTMLADWVNRKGSLGITLETGQANTPEARKEAHRVVERLLSPHPQPPTDLRIFEIECALPSPGNDLTFTRPLVNAEPVTAGEILGHSRNGNVTAPGDGVIFLPREHEPPGRPCMLFARQRPA